MEGFGLDLYYEVWLELRVYYNYVYSKLNVWLLNRLPSMLRRPISNRTDAVFGMKVRTDFNTPLSSGETH